jgi:hypothetical protein
MAICDITAGYTLSCKNSAGGIEAIYVLSGSITAIDEVAGEITAISGSGTFFEFQLPKGVGSVTETVNSSIENGTTFYSPVAELVVQKLQTSIRNQVQALSLNPNIKLIIQTNNGKQDGGVGEFFLLGRYRGMTVTGGTGQTGTAFGDLSGYSLSFSGQEPVPMQEIAAGNDLATALSGITVA